MSTLSALIGVPEVADLPALTLTDTPSILARVNWMHRVMNRAILANACGIEPTLTEYFLWTDFEKLVWAWATPTGEDMLNTATEPSSPYAALFSASEQSDIDRFTQMHYEAYGKYPYDV